jgi:hypothetical protein
MARVAANARRLAGDQRMLVGESDSYAGAIGRPDRDDRIVAEALAPSDGAEVAKAFVGRLARFPQRKAVASGDEMLVEAAKEVSAGAAGHERSRIITSAQQPRIGQAALLGLVRCGTRLAARLAHARRGKAGAAALLRRAAGRWRRGRAHGPRLRTRGHRGRPAPARGRSSGSWCRTGPCGGRWTCCSRRRAREGSVC